MKKYLLAIILMVTALSCSNLNAQTPCSNDTITQVYVDYGEAVRIIELEDTTGEVYVYLQVVKAPGIYTAQSPQDFPGSLANMINSVEVLIDGSSQVNYWNFTTSGKGTLIDIFGNVWYQLEEFE